MTFYKTAILALGLIFSAGQALACSCAPHPSATVQAENYPLIFVGTALASVDTTPPIERTVWQRLQFWKSAQEASPNNIRSFSTEFRVHRVLKGADTETVSISHLGTNTTLCGVQFVEGDEYLILAHQRDDGSFGTNLCASPQFSLAEFEAALAAPSTPVPSDGTDYAPNDVRIIFGTWGADEVQCSKPQEVRGAPFILSQTRFDQYETHCDVRYDPVADPGGWNMSLTCSVEGHRQTSEEWVAVFDGVLLRSFNGGKTAQEFIRCQTP